MPTLLQINVTVNTGSTGRIAEEIGQRAIAAGYESYIAYGRTARESQSHLLRIGSKRNVRWHMLISLLFDAHGFASKRATKQLVKQIDRICPDIILLHNVHGYYLNIKVLFNYLKDKNIPIFWTLHDCWPFTGHCAHFMAVNCEKYKTYCHDCPNKKKYPCSIILDRSKKNYTKKKELIRNLPNITFIPVCKWMDSVVDDSFMKGTQTNVIYNGVNVTTFKPSGVENCSIVRSKYGILEKKIILGVASTWKKKKALFDFYWLNDNLSNDYQVVLVGLSEKQIEVLPNGIVGIRRTESIQELAALYSLADVFVNPTYVDNFPTTNIESLACGTPVITYNTGGSPEAVDENTGVVVPKGDKEALKKAIVEVVANKKKYSIENCRQRAVANFNKDDRFDDYIKLFNSALDI